MKPQYSTDVVAHALNIRGGNKRSNLKREDVEITDEILRELTDFPVYSRKFNFFVKMILEKKGRAIKVVTKRKIEKRKRAKAAVPSWLGSIAEYKR